MSRVPLDEELNIESQDYDVRDILAEYWMQAAAEEEPVSVEKRGLSRSSLEALRASDEQEESVRIYQPKRNRDETPERLATLWGETPEQEPPEEEPEKPEELPEQEPSSEAPRRSALDLAESFLGLFRRDSRPGRSAAEMRREKPEELPSFDELLWGKKSGPVRIEEEDESSEPVQEGDAGRVSAGMPEPPRREKTEPEFEIHIPEEDLADLSVNAILAEYWTGLEEKPSPVELQQLPRGSRRQQSAARPAASEKVRPFSLRKEQKASSGKESRPLAGLFGFGKEERAASPRPEEHEAELTEEPSPEPYAAPAPAPEEPISVPAPAVQREPELTEEDVLNMSVSDILSEFWAGYTEPAEQPAPRADAPRSRREAARMREEASPVPPTDAAPSAAENETSLFRRRKPKDRSRRDSVTEPDGKEEEAGAPRRSRKEARRGRESFPAPPADLPASRTGEEDAPEPVPESPAPVDPAEAASMFSFLRKGRRAEPAPEAAEPENAAAPAIPREEPPKNARRSRASSRPAKMIDEDVEFGAMSVDEILAEYNDIFAAIPAAADAIGAQRQAEAAKEAEEAAEQAPPVRPEPPKRSEAPVGRSAGRVSRMEEEARDMLQQMRSESFASGKEEPRPQGGLRRSEAAPRRDTAEEAGAINYVRDAAEASAAMPSLTAADWGESLRRLLGQDPAPPQPASAAEPSRSEAPGLESSRGRSYGIPSDEVDPRFNLSGERKSTMVFGGKELDTSADESYIPPKAASNVGFHWVAGEEELPEKPLEKTSFFRKPKKEAPPAEAEGTAHTESYDDRKRPDYAPDRDYDEGDDPDDPGNFPSFGQYLSGLVSGLMVRVFGARRGHVEAAGTMEDEDEDLGPEVSPAAASKYYGSFVTSLRIRVRIGLVLLFVLTWITFGLPVTGALRSVQVASGMALAIQLTILLLGLDVVTGSLVNLARGRFGADSLAVLSCFLTCLDALSVCLGFMGTPHMPLCLISSLSFLGVLISSLVSARGLRKALRVPAIGRRCYGVTAESDVKGSGLTLLKSLRPPKGFVRRTEEAAPDESAFTRVAPILAILALVLTLVVALAKHAFPESLYILTVILSPAVPVMALLCFALPFLFGSLRIFHSGAAIAGWSGVSDIGHTENLIVTDRDLFPEGSVEIDTVRIFAEVQPETIISYAGTMVCASGSDLAPCFAQLMEKNGCPMRRVEGYEFLSGGGMKGVIDGSVILCGGLDLMRLMNVRVPYRLVGKTTVLLAVDGILCGIFNMKYEGQPQVRKALVGLIRSNRHPIFAIRDFLVTPEMLSDCFEVATDGYDFPPYVDRFAISEAKPSAESKLAAVVCREGLGPLVHMADTGRSMYLTVRINLLLTVLAAVIGVAVVFVKLLSAGVVSSGFLFLFLILWALPVLLISAFLRL